MKSFASFALPPALPSGGTGGAARAAALALLSTGGGAEALQQLGEARLEARLYAEALVLLHAAQAVKPQLPGLDAALALASSGAGRHEQALDHYCRALGSEQAGAEPGAALGTRLLLGQGRSLVALQRYAQALAPLQGAVARVSGGAEAAGQTQARFASAEPGHGAASEAGVEASEMSAAAGAEAPATPGRETPRGTESEPARALACEAHMALGDAFAGLYRCVEALGAYRRAAALDEGRAEVHVKIGAAFVELGRCAAALQPLRRALELAPDDAGACDLLGLAIGKMGRYAEALGWFERALVLRPHCAVTFRNMGNALTMLRLDDQALECFRAARRIEPQWDLAWLDEAGTLLRRGDLIAGWKAYEWRESARMMAKLCATCWSGDEDLRERTILLIAEQGIGDTLQFVRYVPLLLARGAQVLLQVQAPLKALLQAQAESWGVAHRVTVLGLGEPCPEVDWKCLMMSLPHVFRTRLDTIPAGVPYLHAPAERAARWRRTWLPAGRLRVGVAWAGNPHFAGDATRSMPLAIFEPLLRLPGIEWVLLQPDVRPADAALLARLPQVRQFGAELGDFADTAALVEQVDLVIAVDTSVAHLAGALGRPLWLLLPFMPDWRWLHDRDDTPWYPSARLFRQRAPLDWPHLVGRVSAALQSWQEEASGRAGRRAVL